MHICVYMCINWEYNSLSLQQFRIEATDLGIPPKKSPRKATIRVLVVRNKFKPKFSNLPATLPLPENTETGAQIFAVEAIDEDTTPPLNNLTFSIVGDDSAPAYFKINGKGQIMVKTDLKAAPGTEVQYKVMHAK